MNYLCTILYNLHPTLEGIHSFTYTILTELFSLVFITSFHCQCEEVIEMSKVRYRVNFQI